MVTEAKTTGNCCYNHRVAFLIPLILLGAAALVVAIVSSKKAKEQADTFVRPASVSGGSILVHSINDDRCTGCDACVAVCPTNVLDLVQNKSRVLRFQDCIQCEACMWVCPTEALVMHREGTKPPPLQVPDLQPTYETKVPGQYLIGEVAGKPLVKNAANIGRAVVRDMLKNGLPPGALGKEDKCFDVIIVGSGPGGLSAALTCIRNKLSYVVLEKEQMIASTIARYPKGKLIMAEPYDAKNLSLLPIFDSSKENLLPIWQEVVRRSAMNLLLGETVEVIEQNREGVFRVKASSGAFYSQRVVLSTGTRGKPRTLGVPGENLAKVHSLLEDPQQYRGGVVLVAGGGDSALEAAMALADAGASVLLSYRGKQFHRASSKNKQAIGSYVAGKKIKCAFTSQVIEFAKDTVTLSYASGGTKTYPNDAAFVLIGSDPPVQWLGKLGIRFVDKPHSYALGKTDDLVASYVPTALECPKTALDVMGLIGKSIGSVEAEQAEPSIPRAATGVSSWIRRATSVFGFRSDPLEDEPRHSGNGRRDSLSPRERTRVLRMLRDDVRGNASSYFDENSAVEFASEYASGQNDPVGQQQSWQSESVVEEGSRGMSDPIQQGFPRHSATEIARVAQKRVEERGQSDDSQMRPLIPLAMFRDRSKDYETEAKDASSVELVVSKDTSLSTGPVRFDDLPRLRGQSAKPLPEMKHDLVSGDQSAKKQLKKDLFAEEVTRAVDLSSVMGSEVLEAPPLSSSSPPMSPPKLPPPKMSQRTSPPRNSQADLFGNEKTAVASAGVVAGTINAEYIDRPDTMDLEVEDLESIDD